MLPLRADLSEIEGFRKEALFFTAVFFTMGSQQIYLHFVNFRLYYRTIIKGILFRKEVNHDFLEEF